jgi:hypothetical protein
MSVKNPPTPLGIVDLLRLRGFDTNRPAKLIRHKDPARWDVEDLRRRGWLDFYQATQGRPVFDGCERIVSFVGTTGTKARLIGIYSVLGRRDRREAKPPRGFPPELCDYRYCYDLKRDSGYEDLENRVVIEWGKGVKQYVQWLEKNGVCNNKEVVELLPSGQTLPAFRDYLEFTLPHPQLKELYDNEDANREWRARLSAVAGVYLILAKTTGKQYVGSAYGAKGIWGRWAAYARNGHGGNKLLKDLIAEDSAYPEEFSYSILEILPKSFTSKEVVKCEQRYKEKLGSCAIGLNVK